MPRAISSESGIHFGSMDCSQASPDDVTGLTARLRSNLQWFRGVPLITPFRECRIKKCKDL
jgi:hypothetical protein